MFTTVTTLIEAFLAFTLASTGLAKLRFLQGMNGATKRTRLGYTAVAVCEILGVTFLVVSTPIIGAVWLLSLFVSFLIYRTWALWRNDSCYCAGSAKTVEHADVAANLTFVGLAAVAMVSVARGHEPWRPLIMAGAAVPALALMVGLARSAKRAHDM